MYKGKVRTDFADNIIFGNKVHTFREGFRLKPGDKLHFYQNNPRNRKTDAQRGTFTYAFNPVVDNVDWWKDEETGAILHKSKLMVDGFHGCPELGKYTPLIAGIDRAMIQIKNGVLYVFILQNEKADLYALMKEAEVRHFCEKDGFRSYDQAADFFQCESKRRKIVSFHGQIIHWSEKTVYNPQTAQIFRP